MHDDHERLDQGLVDLERSLQRGDHEMAVRHLAVFALELGRYIRREEQWLRHAAAVSQLSFRKIHREHTSLRRLVAWIARALARADDRRGIEATGTLRSVLLLHVAKEQWLLGPSPSQPSC
jgi:hypothetical protein